MIKALLSLDALRAQYDALFCDVWGVVHNGRARYFAACAALQRFRQAGGICLLVSNVPKPACAILAQLDRLGVPKTCWDGIVTSGDATRAVLAARAPGPMHRIGPIQDSALWDGLGLIEASLDDAAFLAVSGPNHWRETPDDYRDLLSRAKQRNLEMVCANPDIQVREGDQLIYCAGALARAYKKLGGLVTMAGKPHAPIYALAREKLAIIAGRAIPASRVLAIGDGIETDLLGAQNEGLDALFIAGGMHGQAFSHQARFQQKCHRDCAPDNGRIETSIASDPKKSGPDFGGGAPDGLDLQAIHTALTQTGVRARYVMAQLS